MDDSQFAEMEARLKDMVVEFRYPPLPDIPRKVLPRLKPAPTIRSFRPQKLTWVIVVLIAVMAGALVAPPVRAQILEFFQIGVVKIFQPPASETQAPTSSPGQPSPAQALLPSLQAIAGQTNLQSAQERVGFPIRLPTYPTELGEPDLVFLQDMGGPVVVLVWLDPQAPEQVRLSLHLVSPGSYAIGKSMPHSIEMAEVNGQTAVWAEGPYFLNMRNGNIENFRLIQGYVLIWEEDGLTYRLETDLPLREAVKVAESLK